MDFISTQQNRFSTTFHLVSEKTSHYDMWHSRIYAPLPLLNDTPAPSVSSKAGFAQQWLSPTAASALAARENGRGLRFLTRKRNSVFKIRIAA